MKEDAPPPKHPPTKRRILGRAPDHWLAIWANDNDLSKEERERAQLVRNQRKAAKPDRVVGVVVDREDVTPIQLDQLRERLKIATEIHHPWATRRVVGVCRHAGVPFTTHQTLHEVVHASTIIIAAPRGRNHTPAWDAIAYARHRKLDVTVILPDGTVERRN